MNVVVQIFQKTLTYFGCLNWESFNTDVNANSHGNVNVGLMIMLMNRRRCEKPGKLHQKTNFQKKLNNSSHESGELYDLEIKTRNQFHCSTFIKEHLPGRQIFKENKP